MNWIRFHFISRQVSALIETKLQNSNTDNSNIEDLISEVENSPLTNLYGKEKFTKGHITNKLLSKLKTLTIDSQSKIIFDLYGNVDLSENNKSQKHIRSIITYPITISFLYLVFASLFHRFVFPTFNEIIDIKSLDSLLYFSVQGENIYFIALLMLTVTIALIAYALFAIRLLKLKIKPNSTLLKMLFNTSVQESYSNLNTLVYFPLELTNVENYQQSSNLIKQHLAQLIKSGNNYTREYSDLCTHQESVLTSALKSSTERFKIVLYILVTAAVASLVTGSYSVIIKFGEYVL